MRFVRKGPEPAELRRWKRDNSGIWGRKAFDQLDASAKGATREQLLAEQGHLCAYTMMRIGGDERVHIEHIRSQRRYPDLTVDCGNMLACASGNGAVVYAFGGAAKGDADVSADTFVSPLHPSCEVRFRYSSQGEIDAADPSDAAASATIKLLNLRDKYLVALRRQVLVEITLGSGKRRPLSPSKARRLAEQANQPDASGRLPAFCIAIQQVATKIADRQEKLARRLANRKDR